MLRRRKRRYQQTDVWFSAQAASAQDALRQGGGEEGAESGSPRDEEQGGHGLRAEDGPRVARRARRGAGAQADDHFSAGPAFRARQGRPSEAQAAGPTTEAAGRAARTRRKEARRRRGREQRGRVDGVHGGDGGARALRREPRGRRRADQRRARGAGRRRRDVEARDVVGAPRHVGLRGLGDAPQRVDADAARDAAAGREAARPPRGDVRDRARELGSLSNVRFATYFKRQGASIRIRHEFQQERRAYGRENGWSSRERRAYDRRRESRCSYDREQRVAGTVLLRPRTSRGNGAPTAENGSSRAAGTSRRRPNPPRTSRSC